ncbi:MAG: hypothetical protein ACXVFU_15940, partial [Nocardioidaceae bacterium]
PLEGHAPPAAVVEQVLSLRGHGQTLLAKALEEAAAQLARSRADRKVVLLLSDCRASEGEDAVPAARALPELVVLAPYDDSDQAQELARLSGARWAAVRGPSEVPALLDALLA